MKWLALVTIVSATPVLAQVPPGYKVQATISATTAHGPQSQTWFLRSTAWCGKTADGWSPTMGTGRLSVTCRR
jgi:hypothetical protein